MPLAHVAALALLALLGPPLTAVEDWRDIDTVAEAVAAYPQRMQRLVAALDLGRAELAEVAKAVDRSDLVAACEALLLHYRQSDRWSGYRRPALEPSRTTDPAGEDLLAERHRLRQEVTVVPTGRDGRLDWFHTGPDRNKQFAKRLHRHGWFGNGFAAFERTGNPAYLAHLDLRLRDWATDPRVYQPPEPSFHNSIDYGIRIRSWVRWFHALQQEDDFKPATRLLLLSHLPEDAAFLTEHVWDPHLLNHSSFASVGIAAFAGGWPEFRFAAEAARLTVEQIRHDLDATVYPDGVQMEMSHDYHSNVVDNFTACLGFLATGGWAVPEELRHRLEAMRAYQVFSQRPDGSTLANGDSAQHPTTRIPEDLLARHPTWRHVCTQGSEGSRPEGPASVVFPWAGHVIARSGWDRQADWWLFDVGPFGSGHGDPDRLHLSLHAHGRDLLVDSGKFPYGGRLAKQFRWTYGKHSRGHNVILVDGHSQAWLRAEDIQRGVLGIATRPLAEGSYAVRDDLVAAFGSVDRWNPEHPGWTPGRSRDLPGRATHHRGLVVLPGRFAVVVDRIVTDRGRQISPLWHFAPDCTVAIEGPGVVTTDAGLGNCRIVPVGGMEWRHRLVTGQLEPVPQGWNCRRVDQVIEPATCAVYEAAISGDATFAWIIVTAAGAVPAVRGDLLAVEEQTATVRVEIAGQASCTVVVPITGGSAAITP